MGGTGGQVGWCRYLALNCLFLACSHNIYELREPRVSRPHNPLSRFFLCFLLSQWRGSSHKITSTRPIPNGSACKKWGCSGRPLCFISGERWEVSLHVCTSICLCSLRMFLRKCIPQSLPTAPGRPWCDQYLAMSVGYLLPVLPSRAFFFFT